MAPHSSALAWRIPWTEKPGRLQSMGSHRVGHNWSNLAAAAVNYPDDILKLPNFPNLMSTAPLWRSFYMSIHGSSSKRIHLPMQEMQEMGSNPWSGKTHPRRRKWGNGNPSQYSCLESSMDRGAWWAALRGVTNSWTWISMHMYACSHIIIIMIVTYIKSFHSTALTSKETPNWQHSFVIWPYASHLKLFKSAEFLTSYKPSTPTSMTLHIVLPGLWFVIVARIIQLSHYLPSGKAFSTAQAVLDVPSLGLFRNLPFFRFYHERCIVYKKQEQDEVLNSNSLKSHRVYKSYL